MRTDYTVHRVQIVYTTTYLDGIYKVGYFNLQRAKNSSETNLPQCMHALAQFKNY
jgi:hypothetical protein